MNYLDITYPLVTSIRNYVSLRMGIFRIAVRLQIGRHLSCFAVCWRSNWLYICWYSTFHVMYSCIAKSRWWEMAASRKLQGEMVDSWDYGLSFESVFVDDHCAFASGENWVQFKIYLPLLKFCQNFLGGKEEFPPFIFILCQISRTFAIIVKFIVFWSKKSKFLACGAALSIGSLLMKHQNVHLQHQNGHSPSKKTKHHQSGQTRAK